VRGITVVLIDHVVKNPESRGKYAIGSERKLGQVDVHLGLEVVKALTRGGGGVVKVVTHKDRPGHLRRPRAGELRLESDPDTHQISWTFDGPTENDPSDEQANGFRPTVLMDRVLEYLSGQEDPVSRNSVCSAVRGTKQYVLHAIDVLVADKRVNESRGPNHSRLLTIASVVRPSGSEGGSPIESGGENHSLPSSSDEPLRTTHEPEPLVQANPHRNGTGSTRGVHDRRIPGHPWNDRTGVSP
jgi:hypothetical protein